jgi:5'-nucleotidase
MGSIGGEFRGGYAADMIAIITNDDGIDAPGLAAFEAACRGRATRLIVVAPKHPHSGCGHRITTDRPLAMEKVGPDRYHVDGTPADCVRLALANPATTGGQAIDWVLSGINEGGNLGVDIHHSGTVAAAREAAMHGIRAVAASQYRRREATIDWERAAAWMADVLGHLVSEAPGLAAGEFWNVNLPHPPDGEQAGRPPIVACGFDPSPLPIGYAEEPAGWRYRSRYQERGRLPGHDVATCFGGQIALTRGRVV